MSQLLSTTLYYREGSSDKQYNVQLSRSENGFVVNFQYGRRGSALKSGTKTVEPIDYDAALKTYTKLIKSKTSEGYTEEASGAVFSMSVGSREFSGRLPQLLNEITEAQVEQLINDPEWGMQEKFDGERRGIHHSADGTLASNKKGLYVGIKSTFAQAMAKLGVTTTVLDGEDLGDRFVVFDVLEFDGKTLATEPYVQRHNILSQLQLSFVAAGVDSIIQIATLATTSALKRALYDEVKNRNGEGVVFRRLQAPYTSSRPNSGGDVLKFKFVATATVKVIAHNANKRSVKIAVSDAEGVALIEVGNVTIPVNKDVPPINSFIEVQYLYAYKGGSLFQPQYKGQRNDQDHKDISVEQLKFVNNSDSQNAA